jgi:hypothetical protein
MMNGPVTGPAAARALGLGRERLRARGRARGAFDRAAGKGLSGNVGQHPGAEDRAGDEPAVDAPHPV